MKQNPSSRRRRSSIKSVLRLPDLEHAKATVLKLKNRTATRPAPGHDTDHSFPRGCPHREVSFRRRRSLCLIISFKSAAGRISIRPHFNFTPGFWEMS